MMTDHSHAMIDSGAMSELVQLAWTTFIGDDIQEVAPLQPAAVTPGVHATISIGGPWIATIIVSMGEALVNQYANALLEVPIPELTDADVRDAIGELANIVGGNVKGMLDDAISTTLSLPVVSSDPPTIPGGRLTVALTFEVFGQPMIWQIHERL